MPPTSSTERSLIGDAQFFAELERFARSDERSIDPTIDGRPTTYADAFDGLESGLPVDPRADPLAAPHHRRPPIDAAEPPIARPTLPETRVSLSMAAVVLAACLIAGAATAAYAFQDRVEQITALRMATR